MRLIPAQIPKQALFCVLFFPCNRLDKLILKQLRYSHTHNVLVQESVEGSDGAIAADYKEVSVF